MNHFLVTCGGLSKIIKSHSQFELLSFSFCLKSEKNEHVLLVCLIEQVGASVGAVLLGLTHV